MSNAEKLRAMNDEELACFLHNMVHYDEFDDASDCHIYFVSVIFSDDETDTVIHDSYADILEWLQADAKRVIK